jgi:hypothetical protein
VLTARTAGLAIVVGVGLLVIIWRFLGFESRDGDEGRTGTDRLTEAYRSLFLTGIAIVGALLIVSQLPDVAILTLTNVPVEPIAIMAAIPLGYLAMQVIGSRDARRFVVGLGVAVVAWFVILYPNISALPLPSAVVNAYQGILPTYLYAFQFPVSTVDRNQAMPILTPTLVVLSVALAVTCLVVAYSAWVWRLALAERTADAAIVSDDTDGLARTGGA